jgi:hypothetical protein
MTQSFYGDSLKDMWLFVVAIILVMLVIGHVE